MKKIAFVFFVFIMMLPILVKAEVNEEKIISETTKYYKTITFNNNVCSVNDVCNDSITYEVSKEEYDNYVEPETRDTTVETTYKRLNSSITQSNTRYKYRALLTWKNMPSKRSYDIIGIGFYQTVKVWNNDTFFYQNYCISGGSCSTTYLNYPQIFVSGAGTSFLLPSGTLSSLSEEFYFYVEKNTTGTIVQQLAASDYAHATKTISLANSKKYTVNSTGINHNGNSSYYDAMSSADAYWYGTW